MSILFLLGRRRFGEVRRYVEEDIASGRRLQGCPLNNLAQEMSPLDPRFHDRIQRLYALWRERFAAAVERGIATGAVTSNIDPNQVADGRGGG